MTGKQRVENIFNGKPVDKLPASEDYWGDTLKKWRNEGHLGEEETPEDHFNYDIDRAGLVNWLVDPEFENKTLEENEDTALILDGNGARLRYHKKHASTPEHVGFQIKDKTTWEKEAKGALTRLNRARIPFEEYRDRQEKSLKADRYFLADAFGPFEMMQRLVGHEALLMAMGLESGWVKDMVLTYSEFNITHWDELFKEEGLPHGIWIAEDLGFKLKPFMSPQMFNDIMVPGYKLMFDYIHSKGLKIILHSCGYIEPLIPALIKTGLDCLEAMEYKAGMDMPELFKKYGNKLVYYGNIDIRVLESNNKNAVDQEIKKKICPVVNNGGKYIIHSDHSISTGVEYDTYKYFLLQARNCAATAI